MAELVTRQEPWAQLAKEPDNAYARFLIFRNCGINRSLRKAYRWYLNAHKELGQGYAELHNTSGVDANGKTYVPAQWLRDYQQYDWAYRATQWDLSNLGAYGGRVAVLHVQALTKIAEKNVRWAGKLKPGDRGYADLCDSVRLIAEYLNPEVVAALREKAREEAEHGQIEGEGAFALHALSGGIEQPADPDEVVDLRPVACADESTVSLGLQTPPAHPDASPAGD